MILICHISIISRAFHILPKRKKKKEKKEAERIQDARDEPEKYRPLLNKLGLQHLT